MSIDGAGPGRGIGLLANGPVVHPGELTHGDAAAGLCHAGQPEIDAVGENGREQCCPVLWSAAATLVDEAIAETDPAVDLQQQVGDLDPGQRSEEHTSELQSLMRISYAVFCLKKKKQE